MLSSDLSSYLVACMKKSFQIIDLLTNAIITGQMNTQRGQLKVLKNFDSIFKIIFNNIRFIDSFKVQKIKIYSQKANKLF